MPKLSLAGRLQTLTGVEPEWAQMDVASQVGVSLAEGIQPDVAFRGISEWARGASAGSTWHEMISYGPWKSSEGFLRMRRYGTAIPAGEGGDWAWDVYGLGKDAGDMLKRLPISMSMRQEAEAFGIEPGQGMGQVQPGRITGMGYEQRAGYKWLNMLMPGETQARAAMVQPGTYFTGATPFPGSMAQYRSAALESGISAFGYPQTESFQMQLPHMARIRDARFEFGVMRQAKGGAWEKVRDITGYTLPAGESAVVGTYTVGETTHPLRVTAGGTPVLEDHVFYADTR
jgi:hypothetical protein